MSGESTETESDRPFQEGPEALGRIWRRDLTEGRPRSLMAYLSRVEGDEVTLAERFVELERSQAHEARTSGGAPGVNPLDVDDVVGPYRLVELLGRGGQAVVWRAVDSRMEREVALKLIPRAALWTPTQMSRFHSEASLASKLEDSRICTIYDSGVDDGQPYIAMRLVRGGSLAEQIEAWRGRAFDQETTEPIYVDFEESTAEKELAAFKAPESPVLPSKEEVHTLVGVIEQAARAMQSAHEAGVIHRDLKPANIMLGPDGQPVIVDFGLAQEDDASMTTGSAGLSPVGTLRYMSPEQLLMRQMRLDHRADVYSLGVTLYEAIALRCPFTEGSREALCHSIATKAPPNLQRLNPAVNRDLRTVVERAIEKDRDRRYQQASEFAEDLLRVQRGEAVAARPIGGPERAWRWLRQRPAVLAILALATILVVGGPLVLWSLERAHARDLQANSDRLLSADLLRREAELYPLRPSLADSMRSWIDDTEALLERAVERPFEHDEDRERVKLLRERLSGRRQALASAESLAQRSLKTAASRWEEARRSIKGSEYYGGLDLKPQLGLVPRAENAQGLWEFYCLHEGASPNKDHEATASWPIVLILIPGSSDQGLAPFFLAKNELSQAAWLSLMPENPSRDRAAHLDLFEGLAADETHPVESIDWFSAQSFARRAGLRLPTEIEWEWACRGGGEDEVWWGDSSQAPPENVYLGDPAGRHLPVGRFSPNPYGLMDMMGNVSEWCDALWSETLGEPAAEGEFRAPVRGANFVSSSAEVFASSYRSERSRRAVSPALGFRMARSVNVGADAAAR